MTWWNINQGESRRQSYWVVYGAYHGTAAPYAAPRLRRLSLSKVKDLGLGETFSAEIEMEQADAGSYTYAYAVSTAVTDVLRYYVNNYVPANVVGIGRKVMIQAPYEKGVYRVYCFVKDKNGCVSSLNRTIEVGPADGKA